MEFVSGNIFIRTMEMVAAGDVVQGHKHNFDHTTYVVRGSICLESLNEDGTVKQTITKRSQDNHKWVLIKAGVAHRITALENDTVAHCIYAHRNPQAEITQECDGWSPAYV